MTLSFELAEVDDLGGVLVCILLDVGDEGVYELSIREMESEGVPLSVRKLVRDMPEFQTFR